MSNNETKTTTEIPENVPSEEDVPAAHDVASIDTDESDPELHSESLDDDEHEHADPMNEASDDSDAAALHGIEIEDDEEPEDEEPEDEEPEDEALSIDTPSMASNELLEHLNEPMVADTKVDNEVTDTSVSDPSSIPESISLDNENSSVGTVESENILKTKDSVPGEVADSVEPTMSPSDAEEAAERSVGAESDEPVSDMPSVPTKPENGVDEHEQLSTNSVENGVANDVESDKDIIHSEAVENSVSTAPVESDSDSTLVNSNSAHEPVKTNTLDNSNATNEDESISDEPRATEMPTNANGSIEHEEVMEEFTPTDVSHDDLMASLDNETYFANQDSAVGHDPASYEDEDESGDDDPEDEATPKKGFNYSKLVGKALFFGATAVVAIGVVPIVKEQLTTEVDNFEDFTGLDAKKFVSSSFNGDEIDESIKRTVQPVEQALVTDGNLTDSASSASGISADEPDLDATIAQPAEPQSEDQPLDNSSATVADTDQQTPPVVRFRSFSQLVNSKVTMVSATHPKFIVTSDNNRFALNDKFENVEITSISLESVAITSSNGETISIPFN